MAPITLLRATGLSLVLVPLCYYSYVEIVRGTEISKRRKRYKRAAEAREAKRVVEGVWDEGKVGEKAEGKVEKVTEEELEEIKIAFASVSIGGRWSNPFPEWREQGAWEWMFWKLIWQPWTGRVMWDGGVPASAQELADSLPVEQPDFIKLFGRHPDDVADIVDLEAPASLSESWDHVSQPSTAVSEAPSRSNSHDNTVTVDQDLTFTWIGQSTSYVQLEGCGIITDPVFAHKTIESFLAHPRLRPPPCPLSSLLSVQLALVSHNHFDHLHPLDVQHLGDSVQWIVPLGMAAFMRTLGVTRVIELDWWENTKVEVVVGGRTIRLEVHAVPAMHWSARSPLDTNQSLWCSFVVKGEKDSFFHCGDTGYFAEGFKAIGRAHGPFSLASLPIGAYSPRWHLRSQHCSPEDAVQMHLALGAKHSVGVHWGTWILSDEGYLDPPKDLAIAREKWGVSEEAFRTVPPGRTLVFA